MVLFIESISVQVWREESWGKTAAPVSQAKLFFSAFAIFFGSSQQPRMKEKYFLFINQKMEFIPSRKMKCPKSAF